MICPNCGNDHTTLYEQMDGEEMTYPFRFIRSWKTHPPLATVRHHIEFEVTCTKCGCKWLEQDASW